jgi:hypothetical protein
MLKAYIFVTEQVQSFTSKPSALPEYSHLLGDHIEKASQLKPVSLPGISSFEGKFLYCGVMVVIFKIITL